MSKATGVTADRNERVLMISWDDDTTSTYSFAGLRAVCPCVECRGGHSNMGEPADKGVLASAEDPTITIERISPVGSYALQFVWSDGHDTGIYTWKYLYEAGH